MIMRKLIIILLSMALLLCAGCTEGDRHTEDIYYTFVDSDNITVRYLVADNITSDNITTEYLNSTFITSDNITTEYLTAENTTSDYISSDNISSEYVEADYLLPTANNTGSVGVDLLWWHESYIDRINTEYLILNGVLFTTDNISGGAGDVISGMSIVGRVPYYIGGNALNDTVMFWDNSNNRLGIVDDTPSTTLDVGGTIHSTGDINSDSDINSGNDVNVTNDLDVTDDADVGGDLVVVGNVNGDEATFYSLYLIGQAVGTPPIKILAGDLLTIPEAGTMEYDGTGIYLTNTNHRRFISQAADSIIESVSVNNTTVETTVFTGVLNADELKSHRVYRANLYGQISTASAADTITIRIHINGTTLVELESNAGVADADPLYSTVVFTVRTTGTTGTISSHCDLGIGDRGVHQNYPSIEVNTEIINNITVTFQWSAAKEDNIAQLDQAFLEVLD
jgi:hypothetical protein